MQDRPGFLQETFEEQRRELRRQGRAFRRRVRLLTALELWLPALLAAALVLLVVREIRDLVRRLDDLGLDLSIGLVPEGSYRDRSDRSTLSICSNILMSVAQAALIARMLLTLGELRGIRRRIGLQRALLLADPRLILLSAQQAGPEEALAFVAPLASRMGIDLGSLAIYLHAGVGSYLPSVLRYRDEDILILPIGFLFLMRTSPLQARSMLAHELAHVLQQDAALWIEVEAWSRFLRDESRRRSPLRPGLLLLLLDLLGASAFSQPPSVWLPFLACAGLVIGWRTAVLAATQRMFGRIQRLRMCSEDNADLAAVLFAEGPALARAIEEYVDDREEQVHRAKRGRIARIRQLSSHHS